MDGKEIKSISDLIHELIERGYGSLTIDEVFEALEKLKEEKREGQE